MSLQNEMRRVEITNLKHKAHSLRLDVESLCKTICINLDCSLKPPESLPISEVDSQWDELKEKWAELTVARSGIAKLEEELK